MENYQHYYAVIMAGGGGTRLWPLSTKKTPKQMVKIFGEETLFQISVNRLEGLFTPERIFVVTVAEQAELLFSQTPQIPKENFLIEPFPKGTASVVGFAATYIKQIDPEAILVILTADHFIQNISEFQNLLKSGYQAAQDKYLVTLGIQPTFAATGYGYIHKGEPVKCFKDRWAFKVNNFLEKPDIQKAKLMFSSGGYDWNSGMFIWHVDAILEEFSRQMPALNLILIDITKTLVEGNFKEMLPIYWEKIIPQTIDYGIMEHASNVIVIPGSNLGWYDVGSWESLFDVMELDRDGNVNMAASYIGFDTSNTLVYSRSDQHLIVTLGIKNLVIVVSDDTILICEREKSQEIKNVVKFLTDNGLEDYL
ncbi:MAG: mannose-1-phosphate guanylyltransferase [Chloroflexi bacterium HGW-Chloroflexi-3]|nr:MAG: mannose-1-phosphate guanylyltransferase [Chloroflexi bacterium HGW-Chloroflexi-3]